MSSILLNEKEVEINSAVNVHSIKLIYNPRWWYKQKPNEVVIPPNCEVIDVIGTESDILSIKKIADYIYIRYDTDKIPGIINEIEMDELLYPRGRDENGNPLPPVKSGKKIKKTVKTCTVKVPKIKLVVALNV